MARFGPRAVAMLAMASLAAWVQPLAARSPRLVVAPAVAHPLSEGTSRLGEGALVFRPAGLTGEPRPLLVLFHGAGMSARQVLDDMVAEARRCGCLLLALASRGSTWDMVSAARGSQRGDGRVRLDSLFGADADRVERALSRLLGSPAIDRRRIVLIGFSDGASYALSLALANPQLVRGAVAIAPGFHLEPGTIDPSQRLFIAHSPEDRVLSFANSRDHIAASLRAAGFAPVFHPYPGGHFLDRGVVAIGVDHVLGSAPTAR